MNKNSKAVSDNHDASELCWKMMEKIQNCRNFLKFGLPRKKFATDVSTLESFLKFLNIIRDSL